MDMTPIDIVDMHLDRYDVKNAFQLYGAKHCGYYSQDSQLQTYIRIQKWTWKRNPEAVVWTSDLVERIGAIHAPLRKDHKTYPLSIRWYDVFLFHRCGYRCLFAWGRFLQFLQLSCTRFLRVSHPSLFSSWTELRKCNNDMKRGKSDWPHWDDGVFGWSWTILTFTTGGNFVQANLFPRDSGHFLKFMPEVRGLRKMPKIFLSLQCLTGLPGKS